MSHVGSHFGCAGQSPPCAWAAATQYVPAIAAYTTVSAISARERSAADQATRQSSSDVGGDTAPSLRLALPASVRASGASKD